MHEVLTALDGDALRRWGTSCIEGLAERCDEINDLNVFPVADSDTGTNLLFTMRAAVASADRAPGGRSAHEVATAMARGATTGARGNSGIILSQVLRGLAEAAADGPLTASTLREALATAAVLVRGAVSVPVAGTIVTVLEAASAAAAAPDDDATIGAIAMIAADGAAAALDETTVQLPILREAGVVDAGGLGLVVLLDALVAVITGQAPERPHFTRQIAPATAPVQHADECAGDAQDFEVMYLITGTDDERIATLRARLGEIGDSVIIVNDGTGCWSSHVHCRDAGSAVEAGLAAGQLDQVRINCFALDAIRAEPAVRPGAIADRGILVVAEGDGAASLFESEGAKVLRCDEPVSGTQLLSAIRSMDNREVLVLPNGALSAQELVAVSVAARDAHRDVLLLPCSSMVQGLASVAVHDPQLIAVDDAFAMSEAASGTRWGSLRIAEERALTLVGTCDVGDGLGLIGREVVVIEPDVRAAATSLLDRVLGLGGEMVTMLLGATVEQDLVDFVSAHIAEHHPGVEVLIYPGGQRGDLLQLGVE